MQISGVTIQGGMNIQPAGGSPSPSPAPGASNFGYVSGGSYTNVIQKFSFSSDGNSTDVGDLTQARNGAGASSSVSGYTSGGYSPASSSATNIIDKFSFSSDGNATDVGDLLSDLQATGGGNSSADNGYVAGGNLGAPAYSQSPTIQKFSFSADSNATDVGDLTIAVQTSAGQNSSISGYTSGGVSPSGSPADINTIQKFAFASDGNGSDVGDLLRTRMWMAGGQNSTTHGYVSGGTQDPPYLAEIEKFPFASDSNSTAVGDITNAEAFQTGQSSATHGYVSGGNSPGTIIDKFAFASDANATRVGTLSDNQTSAAGTSSTENGYIAGAQPHISSSINSFSFTSDGNASSVGSLSQIRNYCRGHQY